MKTSQESATRLPDEPAGVLLKRKQAAADPLLETRVYHKVGDKHLCCTDYVARKRSPLELVLEATDGFVPLWEPHQILRWRFNTQSLQAYENPEKLMDRVRALLVAAISAWGDSAPIRFQENKDNSDFEIKIEHQDDCTAAGCTLAQAFFPDSGRHPLYLYPKLFEQSTQEQVETLVHELGHVFGLRHYFAPDIEKQWPSQIFGTHSPFSIMNYGEKGKLTQADLQDLKKLYASAWSGALKAVNGTPIKFVKPFHALFG